MKRLLLSVLLAGTCLVPVHAGLFSKSPEKSAEEAARAGDIEEEHPDDTSGCR